MRKRRENLTLSYLVFGLKLSLVLIPAMIMGLIYLAIRVLCPPWARRLEARYHDRVNDIGKER